MKFTKYFFVFIFPIFLLLPSSLLSAQEVRTIEIEGYDDLTYSLKKIKARPGEKIKVVMKTISDQPKEAMAHNWVLIKESVNERRFAINSSRHPENGYIAPGSENKIIAQTDMVGGGEQDSVTFIVPEEPGNYTYLCTFPGHYIAGMEGQLIVREDEQG